MSELNSIKSSNSSMQKSNAINIDDIFQVLNRRKKSIILPIISTLLVVFLYNIFAKPVYESNVLLKKESVSDRKLSNDEFERQFSLQTTDELETELEMIKTRSVLEKVINELNLLVTIDEVEFTNGESKSFNFSLKEYEWMLNNPATQRDLPHFKNITIFPPYFGGEYYILKSKNQTLEIYDATTDLLLQTVPSNNQFNLPEMQILVNWPGAKIGDKIYFNVSHLKKTLEVLRKSILVEIADKTSIFNISIKSTSARMAQLLANKIADKYREARLEQKRQTVHNSFEFIDNQLQGVSDTLKKSEQVLSNFKSEQKIAIMDESSKDLINALSELESEKIKTDLELAEYQNKLKEFGREVTERGFFDQTSLSPGEGAYINSPFAALLGQLSDAELKRLDLLQKRKETHPDVINMDDQIAQIKTRLTDYNQNTLTSYRIIINTLRKKQYNLRKLIREYGSKLEGLPIQEAELAKMIRDKNVHEKMYNLLTDKREELRVAEFSKLQDIIIVDSAILPYKPVEPRKVFNIIIGLIFGTSMGLVFVFTKELMDKKISSIDDFEKQYPIPLLAILPKYDKDLLKKINEAKVLENRLVSLMEDQLAFRESYRVLRTKLLHMFGNEKKILMFTSFEENTGKTTVVANFSMTLARAGKKVLIMDCDLRKSAMANFLKLPSNSPGLLQFLTNNLKRPVLYKSFTGEKSTSQNITFIPAGGCVENSSELLESQKFGDLLKTMLPQYEYILIDTAPVTKIVDTLVLGEVVKNVVLVIKPNHTLKNSLVMGIEELNQSNMNLIGFVFNGVELNKMPNRYKEGYGYGYGYGHGSGSVGKIAK